MGCLIKLSLALVLVLLGYGGYGLYVWLTEHEPAPMTCSQFIRAGDPPRWVVLSECEIKPQEAVRAKTSGIVDHEAYFVPVRPAGAPGGQARLVVELKSPALIAEVEKALAGRDPMSIIAPPQRPAPKVVQLTGLIEAEPFTGSKTRRAIRDKANVTRDFAVLREGDRPKLVRPALSLIAGLGMIWGWRLLLKGERKLARPEPKPPYVGPPPPPELMMLQTRMIAGSPPRDISAHQDLLLPMPTWLRREKGDPLREIYEVQRDLLIRGQIVWGNIVQANKLLFEPGPDDHPAAIIYSPDPYFDAHPHELDEIASVLFMVKGEQTSAPLQEFSRILEDEVTRSMRLPVPDELTNGRAVTYTSIMVRRWDLPERRLASGQLPVLILPQQTDCVMIAPWEWWSPALVALWRDPAASAGAA